MFANPLGLLALLAIPAILAIHFLQRKAVRIPISTIFLLEQTRRETASGRRFEKIVPSVPLWMQLLAVLLLTWFLAEPRFDRPTSVQRIGIVIDASASMEVYQEDTIKELLKKIPNIQGRAASLELTVLSSIAGSERLYSGNSVEEAATALREFTPYAGTIDPAASLRLARSIISSGGNLIYLTDHPAEDLPYQAQALSVAKPIENVGFTGVSFSQEDGERVFSAIVKNYGTQRAERTWQLTSSEGKTKPAAISLEPGKMLKLQARLPEGADRAFLALSPDDFTRDDVLPMVIPKQKNLLVRLDTSPAHKENGEKIIRAIDGTLVSANSENAEDLENVDLSLAGYDPLMPFLPPGDLVVFVEDPTSVGKYLTGGIVVEPHPLTKAVNWQSLLVRETLELPRQPNDQVLLWQGKRPLIFLREKEGDLSLIFNFDLSLSNALTQPALIVTLHRFAEIIRSQKVAAESLNFEAGQRYNLASSAVEKIDGTFTDLEGKSQTFDWESRAPLNPGFLKVQQGSENLLTAAVHFADTREADFTRALPADKISQLSTATTRNQTNPDPLWRLWILVVLLAALLSWYFTKERSRTTVQQS